MSLEGNILKPLPGLQATALLGRNIRLAQKSLEPRKRGSKHSMNRMVRQSVENLAGISLIKPTANFINQL
jgi:hypothetical protein